jgi:hypothetical protein
MYQPSIVCLSMCFLYSSYIEAVRSISVMTGTNIGYFPWVSFPAKLILHIKLTFSLDVLGTSKEKVQERPFKCNKLYCNYMSNVDHLYQTENQLEDPL